MSLTGLRATRKRLTTSRSVSVMGTVNRPDTVLILGADDILRFTRRELEIIAWLSAGYTQQAVRMELAISEDTLKKHLYNVRRKIGVSSTCEAISQLRVRGYLA